MVELYGPQKPFEIESTSQVLISGGGFISPAQLKIGDEIQAYDSDMPLTQCIIKKLSSI